MNVHIKILILNWNGKDLIKPCLDSIHKIDYPNYSVMVIDNGSTDNSIEMVKDYYSGVEVFALEKNYGFSGGYNRCFTKLKNDYSEFVLLLNNDTEVDPNILGSFLQAKEMYGDNNLYGGKIFYQDNPKLIWYAGGNVNLKRAKISHRGIRKNDSPEFSKPLQTDYITGCCIFTSMDVINSLKGFDERFNMYGEDVDLCLRAKEKGMNCYYWPDAKLSHHVSASLGGAFSIKKLSKKLIGMGRLFKKQIINKAG
ncbi:MAG: glycosyltransferase family 2 protein [Candidatus Marinimicrobia bacterium]|nr:glycosyltransferase family 2 protein [Candidatus Neomarinimicrobiota bacterium]